MSSPSLGGLSKVGSQVRARLRKAALVLCSYPISILSSLPATRNGVVCRGNAPPGTAGAVGDVLDLVAAAAAAAVRVFVVEFAVAAAIRPYPFLIKPRAWPAQPDSDLPVSGLELVGCPSGSQTSAPWA